MAEKVSLLLEYNPDLLVPLQLSEVNKSYHRHLSSCTELDLIEEKYSVCHIHTADDFPFPQIALRQSTFSQKMSLGKVREVIRPYRSTTYIHVAQLKSGQKKKKKRQSNISALQNDE